MAIILHRKPASTGTPPDIRGGAHDSNKENNLYIIILYLHIIIPNQDVDGRIMLRWIFRKLEGVVGTGWSWLRIGTGGGHLWVR
jgi:hypothetical protein